jgi:hypothetical protein
MDANGGFVVVWQSDGSLGSDNDDWSIQGQRYDSAGTALGGEFQANTYTTDSQTEPAVAVDANGDFAVVWESSGSSGSDSSASSVQGQRYDSAGTALGEEFQVNTYTTDRQGGFFVGPAVAAVEDGSFVVAWDSYGSVGNDDSGFSIQGQRYTTVTPVPSLSPAGLAAAALLVCLAVGLALRRA